METIKERINEMEKVKALVDEWLMLAKSCGNESAYTDSIIELIQKKLSELN